MSIALALFALRSVDSGIPYEVAIAQSKLVDPCFTSTRDQAEWVSAFFYKTLDIWNESSPDSLDTSYFLRAMNRYTAFMKQRIQHTGNEKKPMDHIHFINKRDLPYIPKSRGY